MSLSNVLNKETPNGLDIIATEAKIRQLFLSHKNTTGSTRGENIMRHLYINKEALNTISNLSKMKEESVKKIGQNLINSIDGDFNIYPLLAWYIHNLPDKLCYSDLIDDIIKKCPPCRNGFLNEGLPEVYLEILKKQSCLDIDKHIGLLTMIVFKNYNYFMNYHIDEISGDKLLKLAFNGFHIKSTLGLKYSQRLNVMLQYHLKGL